MVDFHIDLAACLAGMKRLLAESGANKNDIEW
jgi:hypothetical protein